MFFLFLKEPQPYSSVVLPTLPTPASGGTTGKPLTQLTAVVGQPATSATGATSSTQETPGVMTTATQATTTTQATTPRKATKSKAKERSTSSVPRKEEVKTTTAKNDEHQAESSSTNDLSDDSSNLSSMIIGISLALAMIAVFAVIAFFASSRKSAPEEDVGPPNAPIGQTEGTSVI